VEKAQEGRLRVEWIDMREGGSAAATQLFHTLDQYGHTSLQVEPLNAFVGTTHLAGGETIIAGFKEAVERELTGGGSATAGAKGEIDRRGFLYLSVAALADGMNPCAFAAVVLLVSMLSAAGRSRREVLCIGASFAGAVYLTYFVIGVAFFEGLSALSRNPSYLFVSDTIFLLAFGLCGVCAILSLHDAIVGFRKEGDAPMLLQLPRSLKNRMRKGMRAGVHASSLVGGAFAAGVVVSVTEAACTGQVYFPVIAGLLRDSATRARGITMLAWYNFVFIVPLLVVFGAVLAGVGSVRIASVARRNLGWAKLALALVFAGMAVWLWPGVMWPPGVR